MGSWRLSAKTQHPVFEADSPAVKYSQQPHVCTSCPTRDLTTARRLCKPTMGRAGGPRGTGGRWANARGRAGQGGGRGRLRGPRRCRSRETPGQSAAPRRCVTGGAWLPLPLRTPKCKFHRIFTNWKILFCRFFPAVVSSWQIGPAAGRGLPWVGAVAAAPHKEGGTEPGRGVPQGEPRTAGALPLSAVPAGALASSVPYPDLQNPKLLPSKIPGLTSPKGPTEAGEGLAAWVKARLLES